LQTNKRNGKDCKEERYNTQLAYMTFQQMNGFEGGWLSIVDLYRKTALLDAFQQG
jgi:hypothetical protein